MKKVFQTVVDKNKGNCMQAAMASLFDKELDEVPNFIEQYNWWEVMEKFVESEGYEFSDMLYNFKFTSLIHFKSDCFEKPRYVYEYSVGELSTKNGEEYKYNGVNGLFYATVCSPKNFDFNQHCYHAVIIDRFCNVIHDPNPEYKDILQYPFADLIGYNGIVNVYTFEKLK